MLKDEARADDIRHAFENDEPSRCFQGKELAGLIYAALLTQDPSGIASDDIEELRQSGFDDGEILEINQVAAYFSYANRMVLGLGVTPEGETLGLAPSIQNDPDNWSHQ